ncbi:hypothetical protein LCGC14_1258340 [marine sediment metagenome]|uniref:Uncharacterized protein n=1 Tax=marine sediment metagenome TaxID=412755 RepID=A0A0F9NI49_9ZZZZ
MALLEWEGHGKRIILRTDKPLYMNLPPLPDIVLVLSEFKAHRRLRDVCVLLISRFGLTEFEIVRN